MATSHFPGGGGGGGTIGGTISGTQIAYGASSDTLAGSANLVWDGTTVDVGGSDPDAGVEGRLYGFTDGTNIGPSGAATALFGAAVWRGNDAAAVIDTWYQATYNAGAGALNELTGAYMDIENYGGGTTTLQRGLYVTMITGAVTGSTATQSYGAYLSNSLQNGSTGTNNYGVYVSNSLFGGSTLATHVSFYSEAVAGSATNAYSVWHDEQGVFRIKADNTYDAVYQAIPALYNPQFTKYTAGAVNYERWVTQWNGNVLEMGAEKGGTGTLRKIRPIGAGVLTTATLLPTSDPHVVGQLWNNATIVTVSAG